MKKIGEGYYYEVYDIGHNRVLKKEKSPLRFFLYIFFVSFSLKEYRTAKKNIPRIKDVYEEVLKRLPNPQMIGNPTFLSGIAYEQDRVIPLRTALRTASEEQQKVLLEAFIAFIKKLWTYGCHERVFNFTLNNGVNAEGDMVMVDFNEMSFDKQAVIEDIQKKVWVHRWSVTHLSRSMKTFYLRRMAEEMTLENLERLWYSSKK